MTTGAGTGGGSGAPGSRSVSVGVRLDAPPERVWPLLAEVARWPEWSFVTKGTLVRQGSPDPDGVGALRHLTVLGVGSREEVLAVTPPTHLAYAIRSGFPVRNHRADVTLAPDGTGTRLTWAARFDPVVPVAGPATDWLMRAVLTRFTTMLARHLAGRDGGA